MNLNLRKSVLLVGALASLGLSYTTEALATSPNFAVNSVQQSKKVTGNVSDAEGPIIGASVVEKGNPSNGAVTDLDGNFTLNVKPGATIVVTYIGYQKQEIAVGNQSSLKITMKTDDKTLDEVVVVGYGVQKKKLVTGSTIEVRALKKVPVFGKTNKKAASYCTSEQFSDGQILNLFCLTQWLR